MTKQTTEVTPETPENGPETQSEQKFTQAQVNAIVQQRLTEQATNKFGDYDELKTKAEGAKTLEDKVTVLTTKITQSEAKALRSAIAAEYGISTKKGPKGEPSDADLFLTGSDEATLTAQASRLAAQVAERKKSGNVARKEGDTTTEGKGDGEMREFARNLFGRAE